MAYVSEKIQKKLERGLDIWKNKGSFRHYKGCQKSWKGESRNIYEKTQMNEIASKAASEIVKKMTIMNIPTTKKEFEKQCIEAFRNVYSSSTHDAFNRNNMSSVPIQCVIDKLPEEFQMYARILTDSPLSEPYFTRYLHGKRLKEALDTVGKTPLKDIKKTVEKLDEMCIVEKAMELQKSKYQDNYLISQAVVLL